MDTSIKDSSNNKERSALDILMDPVAMREFRQKLRDLIVTPYEQVYPEPVNYEYTEAGRQFTGPKNVESKGKQ